MAQKWAILWKESRMPMFGPGERAPHVKSGPPGHFSKKTRQKSANFPKKGSKKAYFCAHQGGTLGWHFLHAGFTSVFGAGWRKNYRNFPKISKIGSIFWKMAQNRSKWPKIGQNALKMVKIDQNPQKWPKRPKNGLFFLDNWMNEDVQAFPYKPSGNFTWIRPRLVFSYIQ